MASKKKEISIEKKKVQTNTVTSISNTEINSSSASKSNKYNFSLVRNEETIKLNTETLYWIFSIISGLIIYYIVAQLIQSSFHPDVESILKFGKEISFVNSARPEPMEALLFRAGVVTMILCILIFYYIFSKIEIVKNLAQKSFYTYFSSGCFIILVYIIYSSFAANNPFAAGGPEQPQNSRDMVGKSNFQFFFDGLFLGDFILVYTFFLLPLIALIFYLGYKKNNFEDNKIYNKAINIVSYGILGLVLLAIFSMNTFQFPYSFENKYDFNAVYYSVTQVYSGLPMLVDGFSNTYGLYPQFLNPIFKLIGLNITKFTFVMSLLLTATYIFNFVFLRKYVSNKLLWFFGCCSILFFPYFDFKLTTAFDSTFSFFPIRYLIPGTLVFLVSLYLNKQSQIIYWITNIVMGFFILWNPEIGIVSYLSWVAFNLYNDFYTMEGKIAFIKLLLHIIYSVISVVFAFLFYKFIVYIFYGVTPNFDILFTFMNQFGKAGFGLLPMVLMHPWNITAIITILGFTYSIVKWYKKEITPKASVILLVSVLSLGLLFYFQGRSHNWPFAISSIYTFVLLTLLGNELWDKIKDKGINVISLHFLFIIFLFIISFSFFEIVFNAKKINELISQDEYKDKQADEQKRLSGNIDFIKNNTKEKERIYVFTAMQYQCLYFDGNMRMSAFNPGEMDMSFNSDVIKLQHRILDSSYNAFIEPAYCSLPFIQKPMCTFGAVYNVAKSNQSIFMLEKRKTKIPTTAFFDKGDDILITKKYNDDTSGIKSRIIDATGIKQIVLNSEFSVEVLFYSSPQAFPFATLAGNMNDSSGFIIANIVNTPNYFFGINGKGTGAPVPVNEWVYCALNVFPNHLSVYINGNLATEMPLASPIRQSAEKLTFGNMGFLRNFIGAISEIAIHNKAIDLQQIQNKLSEMKSANIIK